MIPYGRQEVNQNDIDGIDALLPGQHELESRLNENEDENEN